MSDAYGWEIDKDGSLIVNSRVVAERFERRHANLCPIIESIYSKISILGADDWFRLSYYTDSVGRKQTSYNMTRDGWDLLVMGFIGDDVLPIKVAFIQAFHGMEQAIRAGKPAPADLIAKIDELQSLFRNGHGRANLPARIQHEHICEVRRQGYICPCCREVTIVSGYEIIKDATGKAIGEFDHFYHVGKAMLTTTWLICAGCHAKLTHGRIPRHEVEPHFRAYQKLLASRQPGLPFHGSAA